MCDSHHMRFDDFEIPDDWRDIPIQIFGLVDDSIVDGPGLRFSVFVQGCSHACPGCHNPESQPKDAGQVRHLGEIYDAITSNDMTQGVTFTGGEPFEQARECAILAKLLKQSGYEIWAYTGGLFEDILQAKGDEADWRRRLLSQLDALVDGPYIEARRSLSLDWRGSANQRILDIPASLGSGSAVLWEKPSIEISKPPSW